MLIFMAIKSARGEGTTQISCDVPTNKASTSKAENGYILGVGKNWKQTYCHKEIWSISGVIDERLRKEKARMLTVD